MINLQDTPGAGPLTAADLADARARATGRIYRLHRVTVEPGAIVTDDEAEVMAAEACTELGADTRPAALSMRRHRTAGRAALVLLLAPAAVVVVAVAAFVAQHWPMAWPLG